MSLALTPTQEGVLTALRHHRTYPNSWVYGTRSTTVRALDALVTKGYARRLPPTSDAPDGRYELVEAHGLYDEVAAEKQAERDRKRAAADAAAERRRVLAVRAGEVESALADALGMLGPNIIVSTDGITNVSIRLGDDDAIDRVRDALLRCTLQESTA